MARLRRWLAYALYYGFAVHLPVSHKPYALFSRWLRYLLAKELLASCGKNVNVEHGADFGLGRGLHVGDNSGLGVRCQIGQAIIGNNVMMGPDVIFIHQNHRFSDVTLPMIESGFDEVQPITVEDNVWIGARAIILPGRTLGEGSIIGAGAVVTKDVAPYTVVGGNPARLIRRRETASASLS